MKKCIIQYKDVNENYNCWLIVVGVVIVLLKILEMRMNVKLLLVDIVRVGFVAREKIIFVLNFRDKIKNN